MLDFKAIELADVRNFMKHWELTAQRSSDYCFPILWGWAADYGYQTAIDKTDDLFWIRQTLPDVYNLAPVGNWQRDDWKQLLCKYFGSKAVFWLVPEELAEIWQAQLGSAAALEEERDNWEYLYDIHELAELAGGKYIKKRNRVNHFKKNYNYKYLPLTLENREAVMEFQQRWLAESEGYLPGIKQEHNCIMRILNSWGEVPHLRGGIIEVSGNIAAYTIGELTGNSVLIHFEKALTEYSAGYQVINQEFLQHLLKEKPKLLTVNREEDLGDEGLRESKLSYHPTGFIRKYKVTIDFNRG